VWNFDRVPFPDGGNEEYVYPLVHEENVDQDLEEWKVFSWIFIPNDVSTSRLNNLVRRDFDIHYNWQEIVISKTFWSRGSIL